tara:strand:+ start:1681 stop:1824 length:144 start_codon:yes stop_codon:yes gene_type:complete
MSQIGGGDVLLPFKAWVSFFVTVDSVAIDEVDKFIPIPRATYNYSYR